MAGARLAAVDLPATTLTTVYTVPASKTTSLSVNVCNRNASTVTVRLALASAASPTAAEWLEYDAAVSPGAPLERTGIVLDSGKLVVAYASAANVSALVYGFEE